MNDRARPAIQTLLDHIRRDDGYGYDPYDVRIGKLYEAMYRSRDSVKGGLLRKGIYGVELLAPVAFRKARGIQKSWDPMGNSYVAGANLALFLAEGSEEHKDSARRVLDQVVAKAVGTIGMRGFGLGFPCITGSYILWPTEVPVSHYTLRVARKFIIWERMFGDGRYAAMLEENIRFLTEQLSWEERDGKVGVVYTNADPLHVINIWADVASVLASYGALRGVDSHKDKAIGLARHVLDHLRTDNTWPYFADWAKRPYVVDNSHTAMVLGALADVALCYPAELLSEVRQALERAVPKWIDLFFDYETGAHWNTPHQKKVAATVALGDALYAIHRLLRIELGLDEDLTKRLRTLRGRTVEWSLSHLTMRNGRFCVWQFPLKKYAIGGVRSFDGLVADALAITYAESRVPQETVSKLWTI